MRRTLLVNLGMLALGAATLGARGDRVAKRDGTAITGTAKQVDGGYEVTGENGVKRFVPSAEISSIKIDNTGKLDEATARDRFESLRRSSENERDIGRAIERYEAIVKVLDGTSVVADANKELTTWRDRRDRKMTRVGKTWLTPAERDALFDDIAKRADVIRRSIATNDLNGAAALLREASPLDPNNMSFQYLAGVLQYRRGQYAESKKSFDAVAEQVPDHPPTLVNQAVLLVRFKRWPQAAGALDAAMAAAPENADVLNDVTEFVQLIPDASRKSNVIDRMLKRYGVQEAGLEERMAAEQKLYRWGSRWVTQAELADFKKQRDAYEQTKREMQTDFDQATARVKQIDEDVKRTSDTMAQMQASTAYRDPDSGRIFQRPLPEAYWDFKRDLDVLNGRRRDESAKIDELKKKAEQIEKGAPAPQYRGTLDLIGEAGVPIVLPATTRPAPASQPQVRTAAPNPSGGQAFIPFRPDATQPAR